MLELKAKTGAAVILITHDLGVVAETCQRVVVMYAGRKVEEAPVGELFDRPAHPYTRGPARLDRARQSAARAQGRLQRNSGHGAVAARADAGLRLRAALPVRHRRLPAAATGAEARRRRAARTRPPCLRLGDVLAAMSARADPLTSTASRSTFPVRRGLLAAHGRRNQGRRRGVFRAGSRGKRCASSVNRDAASRRSDG